jgi:antitoxin CptB
MDDRRKKLRFRAWRRGFREADLILGRFADTHLEGMNEDDLDAFEALLHEPDQDVYNWILGLDGAPEAFEGPLLSAIRAYAVEIAVEGGQS